MPLQRQRRYFNSFFKLLLHAIKKHVVVQRKKKKMPKRQRNKKDFQLEMPLFFFTHSLFYTKRFAENRQPQSAVYFHVWNVFLNQVSYD